MSLLETIQAWARRIKRDSVTLWFASRHPGTPWLPKAIAIFVVAYALSPIDLIPDFIPVLGYVDDALLLPGLIWLALRLVPPLVIVDSRAKADQWMTEEGRKPRSYLGAVLVVSIWIAVAALTVYWFNVPAMTTKQAR